MMRPPIADVACEFPLLLDSAAVRRLKTGALIDAVGAPPRREIGEALAGKVEGPAGVKPTFKALGRAIEDAVAARLVHDSISSRAPA